MKAVFILGALALTLVLVSADTAEESELLVREVRDADARRRKGGRKSKGGKKKSAGRRKKGRKSGRKGGARKGGARQSTGHSGVDMKLNEV